MKNLYDSFKDYVAVDMLDGENKYPAEGFGPQNAKRGLIFESFPLVLHLKLKRYKYDIQRDAMVKINDRHEFPFEIDLDEFLDTSADRSQPWIYKLHGVFVHSGDLHGGQYFALIKPDREERWLKFDDERVTPVTDKEVLEENYGGEALNNMPPSLQRNQVRSMKSMTNAYVLVYIRESAIGEVLAPLTVDDTPAHLSMFSISCSQGGHDVIAYLSMCPERRIDEERLQVEAKKREFEERHLFLIAKVCIFFFLYRSEPHGFDFRSLLMTHLLIMKGLTWPPSTRRTGPRRTYPASEC